MGSIARLTGVCLAARNNTCVKADFHRINMGRNWESSEIRKWESIEQLGGGCSSVNGSNLEFSGAIFSSDFSLANLCTAQAFSWRTKQR